MPYSSHRPDLMGSAALMPVGSFEAGSVQSFDLVYVAGAFGIDDTGSIYDYVPLPASPRNAIVPGAAETWRMIAPTCVRVGTSFRAVITALVKWGNVAPLPDGIRAISSSRPVAGLPASITLKGGTFAASIERLTLSCAIRRSSPIPTSCQPHP